jgi:hypothetical protein
MGIARLVRTHPGKANCYVLAGKKRQGRESVGVHARCFGAEASLHNAHLRRPLAGEGARATKIASGKGGALSRLHGAEPRAHTFIDFSHLGRGAI